GSSPDRARRSAQPGASGGVLLAAPAAEHARLLDEPGCGILGQPLVDCLAGDALALALQQGDDHAHRNAVRAAPDIFAHALAAGVRALVGCLRVDGALEVAQARASDDALKLVLAHSGWRDHCRARRGRASQVAGAVAPPVLVLLAERAGEH